MPIIPKILVFAGSVRTGAFSGRTADVAQKTLAMQGAEATRISLADYPLPILDADLEREKGVPENAAGLSSSSSGPFAGIRCINHLRAVLVRCQMEVVTPECSVPEGGNAFDDGGNFRDERLRKSMEHLCRTLTETSRLLSTRIEA